MKYFLILLVSITSALLSVEGKIPDYIQVCKRNDPQINQCVQNSIINLRPKLIEGIPELEVPTIDPLRLDKVGLDLGPGFKAEGQDFVLKGASNFEIQDLDVDPKANVCSFTVSVPEVEAVGIYDVDAKIVSIPFKGRGPFHVTAKSIRGRGTLRGKNVMRGGKVYNWFPSMNLKFEVGDYNVTLKNLFDGQPIIAEATNKLLNEEKAEILSSMLPVIEKAVVEYILSAANSIVKHFTWDELFPET